VCQQIGRKDSIQASARAKEAGPSNKSEGRVTFFRQPGCLVLRQLVDFLTVELGAIFVFCGSEL
jgi:hypothetical protein